jgi:recombination associated protein RdgC
MWFKNLQIFPLREPFAYSRDELEQALTGDRFRPCGPLESAVQGWISLLGHDGPLCVAGNDCFLVCLRREEKLLPSSVVNELLNQRIEHIEAEEIRTVGRREKRELKDAIYYELLPKAFTRSTLTRAYVDVAAERLLVDSANPKKAEDLVSHLRRSLGSLPAQPLSVRHAPSDILTRWIDDIDLPKDFVLADQCELRDPQENGGIVRCRRQDLGTKEVRNHLKVGKRAVQLAVEWEERVSVVLTDQPALKRLRFDDLLAQEATESVGAEPDPVALLETEFMLITLELRRLVDRIIEIFGGVAVRGVGS